MSEPSHPDRTERDARTRVALSDDAAARFVSVLDRDVPPSPALRELFARAMWAVPDLD